MLTEQFEACETSLTNHAGHLPKDLKALSLCIETIPVSSSEVEHGFSVMNLICTDSRTSLLVSNISNLMFININGPLIELFHCQSYVKTWKRHNSLATEPQPRRCKPPNKTNPVEGLQ